MNGTDTIGCSLYVQDSSLLHKLAEQLVGPPDAHVLGTVLGVMGPQGSIQS